MNYCSYSVVYIDAGYAACLSSTILQAPGVYIKSSMILV